MIHIQGLNTSLADNRQIVRINQQCFNKIARIYVIELEIILQIFAKKNFFTRQCIPGMASTMYYIYIYIVYIHTYMLKASFPAALKAMTKWPRSKPSLAP